MRLSLQENESFNLQVVKINLTSISLQYFLTMSLSLSLTVSKYLPIKGSLNILAYGLQRLQKVVNRVSQRFRTNNVFV